MGKYDGKLGGLPAEQRVGDPKFADRVAARQAEMRLEEGTLEKPATASTWARVYDDLRALKDELDEQASRLNVSLAAAEGLLHEACDLEDVSSLGLANGHSVGIQKEPVAAVEDPDALRAWAVANGHERQMTLPWQTVNSIAKEHLLAGLAPPAGVRVSVRTKTVLRRG